MISTVKLKIKNDIKNVISDIMKDIHYEDKFENLTSFEKSLFEKTNVSEYKLGSLYSLSNLYFDIFNEVNPFGKYVEIISSYDLDKN